MQEAEVAQRADVGALGDRPQHLARVGALDLQMRHLRRAILDLHVEPAVGGDLPEPVQVGVVAGDRQAVVIGQAEDGAVHDHLALLVADRAVADLADLQRRHVVGEQRVGQRHRIGAAQVPLAQRRLVPQAARRPRRLMLGDRVAEVRRPGPALPVGPGRARLSLDRVERSAMQVSGRHLTHPSFDEFVQNVRAHLYRTDAIGAVAGRSRTLPPGTVPLDALKWASRSASGPRSPGGWPTTSRRSRPGGIGALRVVLGFHLAALIPLTVLVLATDALARVSVAEVAVFVLRRSGRAGCRIWRSTARWRSGRSRC